MAATRIATLLGLLAALAAGGPPVARAGPAAAPDSAQDPAVDAIRFYQRTLSSMRHVRCRFTPSCSEYGVEAIHRYGWIEGSARAADRLMRCNASAAGHYPRGADGRLLDPVAGSAEPAGSLLVPGWLLPRIDAEPPSREVALAGGDPMLEAVQRPGMDGGAALSALRRESLSFARSLEEQGDCYRAATEYQRFAHAAGDDASPSWAFARTGACFFRGSDWADAETAFLTAALLARDSLSRAQAITLEAASRFDAGDFTGADHLLADPPPGMAAVPRLAIRALCAAERGEWERSRTLLADAAASGPASSESIRVATLARGLERGPSLPHRSPALLAVLSGVVPGAGQMAAGRVEDGVRHLLFNAALIATVAQFAHEKHYGAAYVTASLALPFYAGNVLGARAAARQFNRERRRALIAGAIADSER